MGPHNYILIILPKEINVSKRLVEHGDDVQELSFGDVFGLNEHSTEKEWFLKTGKWTNYNRDQRVVFIKIEKAHSLIRKMTLDKQIIRKQRKPNRKIIRKQRKPNVPVPKPPTKAPIQSRTCDKRGNNWWSVGQRVVFKGSDPKRPNAVGTIECIVMIKDPNRCRRLKTIYGLKLDKACEDGNDGTHENGTQYFTCEPNH